MSIMRGVVGAAIGAVGAVVALRVHSVVRERDAPLADVLADVPGILVEDASRISEAARSAIGDGRAATARARIEFDEQVVGRSRRTEKNDV